MAVSIGLDIGLTSLKAAVVDGTAKQPKLAGFYSLKLEPGKTTRALGPADLADLVRDFLARSKVPAGNVVAAIPAASCLSREITVPFARDDQIRKTIKFQAESPDESPAREVMQRFGAVGLPTYVVLTPKPAAAR